MIKERRIRDIEYQIRKLEQEKKQLKKDIFTSFILEKDISSSSICLFFSSKESYHFNCNVEELSKRLELLDETDEIKLVFGKGE